MTNYNERLDDLTRFMESIGWEFDDQPNPAPFPSAIVVFKGGEIV